MTNLFGEPYTEPPQKRKPQDKERRAWENAFQRWSDKASQDGTSPLGCCGYGQICDFCFAKGCQIDCEDMWLDWLKEEKQ